MIRELVREALEDVPRPVGPLQGVAAAFSPGSYVVVEVAGS